MIDFTAYNVNTGNYIVKIYRIYSLISKDSNNFSHGEIQIFFGSNYNTINHIHRWQIKIEIGRFSPSNNVIRLYCIIYIDCYTLCYIE